jgi:hypothetical protein
MSLSKKNTWLLVRKPERNSPVGRQKHRWMDNIKMNFREIEFGGMDWIDVTGNRDKRRALVNTVMNHGFHKMLGSCTTDGLSRGAKLYGDSFLSLSGIYLLLNVGLRR